MLGRFFRNNFMFSEAPSMLDLVYGVTLSEAARARLEEKSQAAREKLGTSWVHHPEYQPNPRHSVRAKADVAPSALRNIQSPGYEPPAEILN
jgi:hypothetical protein